jgi:hypothetical protein
MPQVVTRRIALCSDDVDCRDLVELGYADHFVRHAVELGVDPITAIQMCTINPAEAYRVDDRVGVLAPGRIADVVLVNGLSGFRVHAVLQQLNLEIKRNSDRVAAFSGDTVVRSSAGSHRWRGRMTGKPSAHGSVSDWWWVPATTLKSGLHTCDGNSCDTIVPCL